MKTYREFTQATPADSPWGIGIRVKVALWELCWALFCAWTPKPLNRWRLLWAKVFGATIHGVPYIHARAQVIRPWNLTMRERSCIGDAGVVYCLDRIEIGADATIAQGAYICTGTHDFDHPAVPLRTAPIRIGAHAFIGLRAIVLPGVNVATGSIVGAGAVLTRDTQAWGIYGGNPAVKIGTRRDITAQAAARAA